MQDDYPGKPFGGRTTNIRVGISSMLILLRDRPDSLFYPDQDENRP